MPFTPFYIAYPTLLSGITLHRLVRVGSSQPYGNESTTVPSQLCFSCITSHKKLRNHIYWVTSSGSKNVLIPLWLVAPDTNTYTGSRTFHSAFYQGGNTPIAPLSFEPWRPCKYWALVAEKRYMGCSAFQFFRTTILLSNPQGYADFD